MSCVGLDCGSGAGRGQPSCCHLGLTLKTRPFTFDLFLRRRVHIEVIYVRTAAVHCKPQTSQNSLSWLEENPSHVTFDKRQTSTPHSVSSDAGGIGTRRDKPFALSTLLLAACAVYSISGGQATNSTQVLIIAYMI